MRVLNSERPELGLPETQADFDASLRDLVNSRHERAERARAGADGWGQAAGFAASMVAGTVDPVGLVTMPFGGVGKTVLQTAARTALIGAATEAVAQPFVAQWQNKMGRDYGVGEAVGSVLFAGLGGGVLGGGLHGAGALFRRWHGQQVGRLAGREELRAAGHIVARDAMAESAYSPPRDAPSSAVGVQEHFRRLDETEQRFRDNQPLPPDDGPVAGAVVRTPVEPVPPVRSVGPDAPAPHPKLGREAQTTRQGPLPESLRLPRQKPWSLLTFLKKKGGLKDPDGELAAMEGARQPGLVVSRKRGHHPDDAALMAWEAGYFPEFEERPPVNVFYDAIRSELAGTRRYQSDDLAAVEELTAIAARREEAARLLGDLDRLRGWNEAELEDALTVARGREAWAPHEQEMPLSDGELRAMVAESVASGREVVDVASDWAEARAHMTQGEGLGGLSAGGGFGDDFDIPFDLPPRQSGQGAVARAEAAVLEADARALAEADPERLVVIAGTEGLTLRPHESEAISVRALFELIDEDDAALDVIAGCVLRRA